MRIAELFCSIQGEGRFAGTRTVFVRTTGCNLRCWFCDTPYTSWRPEGQQRRWQDVLDEILAFGCRHVDVTGGEPLLQPEVVPLTRALKKAGLFVTIETAGTVYRPVAADLMSISPKLANSTPRTNREEESGVRRQRLNREQESGVRGQRLKAQNQRAVIGGRVTFNPQPSTFNFQHSTLNWAGRHERLRDNPAVIRRFCSRHAYQLKFVIDTPADLDDVQCWLRRFPEVSAEHVWLMPQAVTAELLREKTAWLKPLAESHGYRFSPRLHIELHGNVRGK